MRREMRPRAGFRVRRRGEVTGHGSFVLPVKQKARMLSLALQEAEIVEDCITKQGSRGVQGRRRPGVGARSASDRGGEADANQARAASLREGNQELIAASRIIEQLPDLVDAASRGIAGSNLTVLGASGVNEMLAGLVGQGLAVLEVLRSSTADTSRPTSASAPPAPELDS